MLVDDLTASKADPFLMNPGSKPLSLRTSTDNHAVRLVDMERHSNMRVVNTDTKGAGQDHFRLPTYPFLEETTAEREGGAIS